MANGLLPDILTFRPRKDEEDIIEWAQRYKRIGRLRESIAEAIRLHIALEEGRITPPDEEAPKAVTLDERTLRKSLIDLLPELAALLAPMIAAQLPALAGTPTDAAQEDPEAAALKRNFTDERMFADDDEEDDD